MANFDDLPIVLQLQYLAQKNSSDIEELLRRAKVVASKLKLREFSLWCNNELLGYPDKENLPSYRKAQGNLSVFNPYQGRSIPFILSNSEKNNLITNVHLHEPIGNYCKLMQEEKTPYLQLNLSKEVLSYLYSVQQSTHGVAFKPALKVPSSVITNVLTVVRNTIFNWSLELEEKEILGEGMQFTSEEKEKAMTSSGTTYHINNMQGVAGDMRDNSRAYQNSTDNSINNYSVADIKDVLTRVKSDLLNADLGDADLQVSTTVVEKVTQELDSKNPKKDKMSAFISMFPAAVEALPSVVELIGMIGS